MKIGRYRRLLLNEKKPYQDHLKQSLKDSTTKTGLKELLRYADRNSMAHSREVRLPFLSHKLVEFAFTLPDTFKINNGWTKFVLRKAMSKTLPQSICWRIDKVGYEPPQIDWLQSEKIKTEINKTAKILNVSTGIASDPANAFNKGWRLLMASQYI